MPTIYKRNCDYCGCYYEGQGKRFCKRDCKTYYHLSKRRICECCGRKYFGFGKRFCSQKCRYKKAKETRELYKELDKNRLIELYVDERLPQIRIAEIFGVSIKLVRRNLNEYGIQTRSANEQRGGQKGDKKKITGGYVKIRIPGHADADSHGWVFEHRWIWEKEYKKQIPAGWVIHHLNGIKDDNKIGNLKAMEKRKHHPYLFREILQERIRKLEKLLVEKVG